MGGTQVGTWCVEQQVAGATSLAMVQHLHYVEIHTLFLHAGVSDAPGTPPTPLSRLPLREASERENKTPEF